MAITMRRPLDDELEEIDGLVVASINDLTARHGFGPIASVSPPRLQRFSLRDDPDGLWLAADDDRRIGFALSWACDDLWFLAQLFVSPASQSSGLGQAL